MNKEFQQPSEIEKNALLAPKLKEKDQNRIPFVITYTECKTNN